MGMLKREMKEGLNCYVHGHSIQGDNKSIIIDCKGKIMEKPCLSTVLVELENPPKGITKQFNVPTECIYWIKQN